MASSARAGWPEGPGTVTTFSAATSPLQLPRRGELRQYLDLTRILAVTEFKLRFFGSVLGYLWTLARPLLLFGVLYVVFTQVIRLGNQVPFYPVVLLSAIVIWTLFSEATGAAVSCLVGRENLIRKIAFPLSVIPLSVVLTSLMYFVLNMAVVVVFMLASGVGVRWTWLLIPLPLLALGVLTVAVSLLVSALFVRYRDMRPIWEVALQVLFWGTPVVYPVEVVPTSFRTLIMCNPLAVIIQQFRHWVIDPNAPSAAQAIGGAVRLLVPFAIAVIAIVLAVVVFRREAPRVAEEL